MQWEVAAGYVGCLRLYIPIKNLLAEPCSLHLDEMLVTLVPRGSCRPLSGGPTGPGGSRGPHDSSMGEDGSPNLAADAGIAQVGYGAL